MKRMRSPEELEEALGGREAILFKHSPRCPISWAALEEMARFAEEHPEAPVHMVDVIEDRSLSNLIAERTSVRHGSPQVIILKDGRVVWHVSHHAVTAAAVLSATGSREPSSP